MQNAKRRIYKNIYGNWRGYVGRELVYSFGRKDIVAAYWLLTGQIDALAGYSPEWNAACENAINTYWGN
jgi:hypothetical protein